LRVKDFSRDCLSISSIYRIISNQKGKLRLQEILRSLFVYLAFPGE
jgi:hypothetical protein